MVIRLFVYFLWIIFLVGPATCYSQAWPKHFGGTTSTWSEEIVETYDKGYGILGQVDPGTGVSQMYAWLIKTNINGIKLWDKKLASKHYQIAFSGMDKTNDGGYVLIGSTTRVDSTDYDLNFLKLNACGEKEWCTIISTPGNSEYGVQIKQVPGGYIGLVSYFRDWMYKRIWLIKLDNNGNISWEKCFAQNDSNITNEEGRNLLVTVDGNYLISGYCYYLIPSGQYGILRPLIIKVDSSGNDQWILPYGISCNYMGYLYSDAVENSSGFYYIGGSHHSDSLQYTEMQSFIKVSPLGQEVYYKDLLSGTSFGSVSTLNIRNNDTLYMGVSWQDPQGMKHMGVSKSDTLGQVTKTKILLEDCWYALHSSIITQDDKLVAIGHFDENSPPTKIYLYKLSMGLEYDSLYSHALTYDSLCAGTIVSDTLNLDDCGVITAIHEPSVDPDFFNIKVFPNPATQKILIEIPQLLFYQTIIGNQQVNTIYHQYKSVHLEIYNVSGKLILSNEILQQNKIIELNVVEWERKLYFARLKLNDKTVASTKFLLTK